jgi:hypothetical protein
LARWTNHFYHFWNVHAFNDVRQTEIHTAESLLSDTSAFEVYMASGKLKRLKSPGIDKIPASFIKKVSRTIYSEIHKLLNFIWNKQYLPEQWKESSHCTY